MRFRRFTAILLAAVLILGMAPAAFAQEGDITIDSVSPPPQTEYIVAKGTGVELIGLPSSIPAAFSDDSTGSIAVSWSSLDYDNAAAGNYTFTAANASSYQITEGKTLEWPAVSVTVAHTVTLPSGTGFTAAFTDGSSGLVKDGDSVSFTVTPKAHYILPDDGVSASDADALSGGGGHYTLSPVADDITIYVTVKAERYTLTTSAGIHSTIDPDTAYDYSADETFTVNFSAEDGYVISSVTVDGTELSGAALSDAIANGYVTLDKKSSHSVAVTASDAEHYTVTFKNGGETVYTDTVSPGDKARYGGNTPKKTGSGGRTYTFAGWSATDTTTLTSNTQLVTLSSYPINANTTLYAVYSLSVSGVNLGVTLDGAGGYTFSDAPAGEASIVSQIYSNCAAALGTALTKVKFGAQSPSYTQYGTLYTNSAKKSLSSSAYYYYASSKYGTYPLGSVYFEPSGTSGTYNISYTAYDAYGNSMSGVLRITVAADTGTIPCTTTHDSAVQLDAYDFYRYYDNYGPGGSLRYVVFDAGSSLGSKYGTLCCDYGGPSETYFTSANIDDYRFYYSSSSYGSYPLSNLYFVPGTSSADYTISIGFTAYYSASSYVRGTLKLTVSGNRGLGGGDIIYSTVKNHAVTIDAGDIEDFFRKTYPSYDLQYLRLNGVPQKGSLYYNYTGGVGYGTSGAVKLTSANYDDYTFYYKPSGSNLYTLSALTYVPSGANYCVSIPFTACYSGTKAVKGSILISITASALGEIYYPTLKNTNVRISAGDFTAAVSAATSSNPSYIRFTSLPPASQGALYYDYASASHYGHKVGTSQNYSCTSSGSYKLSKITFVPHSGFTGSVTVPYIACNASGAAVAAGTLSFGVMNSLRSFADVQADAWYFKYVSELCDNSVVNGYPDGTFKPNGTVTYGEALKLTMLAAGYGQQARTGAHWASGYLSRALADGLLSSSVQLDAAVSRVEIAGIAAKALRLAAPTIPTPFADSSNAHVLALYEKGIVEGSMNSSGVRYFYPSASITRAEISAIIWRMNKLKAD